MQHAFGSKRVELSDLRRCVGMCRDVKVICSIENEDYVKLLKRREADITNVDVADAICRASCRLGLLVDDIGSLARDLHIGTTESVRRLWSEFLLGASKKVDALVNAMTDIEARALERILFIEPFEHDSGSSSYSDYSASESDSSDARSDVESATADESESYSSSSKSRSKNSESNSSSYSEGSSCATDERVAPTLALKAPIPPRCFKKPRVATTAEREARDVTKRSNDVAIQDPKQQHSEDVKTAPVHNKTHGIQVQRGLRRQQDEQKHAVQGQKRLQARGRNA